MEAHLEELEGSYSEDVLFKTIDVSLSLVEARKYGVQALPTVIITDGNTGQALQVIVGPREKQVYEDAIEAAL